MLGDVLLARGGLSPALGGFPEILNWCYDY
jgi:hypothetical protein